MIEWERLSSWGENSQNENRLDFSVLQQKVRVEIQQKKTGVELCYKIYSLLKRELYCFALAKRKIFQTVCSRNFN